ncbi:(2Fe-2S)-binding protein [Ponticaulis sp.]|uniref:(2Fe-2S)-binding protein n=1 Tax=Ponticaulis sp. TaxID=2020902 RepID=UPI000C3A553C|nr:(2Fe-2S)-binding protein [Ponticaulis sp.]MAJ10699.1 (2Fe-2S)-binding protein [Ponticaulis sp.]MDF1680411.1 (2Fe-2S)-binding protein [Ponticaulis sp.]HBH89829.1 (2Fe-2S)-binding protein [Hyphomonadaceae bacterium]HBJ94809.1 (2Fe-2S)-binding protein [Hyphomonadaceae bacterium]|tara:strand:+ start:268 stop:474 length:207 start_codon:yes stop_codon:yes gene_type:complete
MIICVCHNLNGRKVDDAIDNGAKSPKEIQAHHGNKFQCGRCKPEMCARLREKTAETAMENGLVANAIA